MLPRVFIIILNWNGWPDTIECLEWLRKIDYPNYEIVVVDNGSTDDSVEKLKAKDLEFRLLTNEGNLGFAGGNNVGIRYALERKADYILLLNNDTIVDRFFLKELVRVGEKDDEIGILGPQIYFYDKPNKIWFAGGKINKILTKGTHIGYGKPNNISEISLPRKKSLIPLRRDKLAEISECDYITGCAMLVKREVIEKIGLMNEDYFLYYEDADWCLRAQKAGFKCVLAPKAKIWHKCSKSAREDSSSYIYYHSRNGLMLAKYNGSFFIRLAAYKVSGYILGKQVIKLAIPSKRRWAKAVIKGIMDFYKGKVGQL